MQKKISEWHGYRRIDFNFEGRPAWLVCPDQPLEEGKWLYKTEYFSAFPAFQDLMLGRGYYLAHLQNICRWSPQEDRMARPRFCRFISEEFGLHPKCVPIGMSCGGMQAVYLGAEAPECVAALYLDAPVLNYLSCPFGLGAATVDFRAEFERDMGMNLAEMLSFRDHPMDHLKALVRNEIPTALICGDRDQTVPYPENGALLAAAFEESKVPFLKIIKEGCDHHPHGLEDYSPLVAFIEQYY